MREQGPEHASAPYQRQKHPLKIKLKLNETQLQTDIQQIHGGFDDHVRFMSGLHGCSLSFRFESFRVPL